MLLAEAIPPAGPVVLPALAALFVLCALVFAIGCIKFADAFVRALFGTISGAVGWIPFAGKVSQTYHLYPPNNWLPGETKTLEEFAARARAELSCLAPSSCRTILEALPDRVVHRSA